MSFLGTWGKWEFPTFCRNTLYTYMPGKKGVCMCMSAHMIQCLVFTVMTLPYFLTQGFSLNL